MKFADLISRIENYLKENPKRLSNDLSLIVDELHSKHSEYKRIKKAVFKRQVDKAYEILSKNDKFVSEMETKIRVEEADDDDDEDVDIDDIDFDTIDDQALAVDIRGDGADGSNEINNFITNIYQKKSNLKQQSGIERPPVVAITIPAGSPNPARHVHFNDFRQEKFIDENSCKKRKLPTDSIHSNQTNNLTNNTNIIKNNNNNNAKPNNSPIKHNNNNNNNVNNNNVTGSNKQSDAVTNMLNNNSPSQSKRPRKSSTNPADKELVKSQINFEAFACDQEIKENIFRRIYYVLSPEHFLVNGKTPPRGFLLHGPPGCGKSQLVYAIAGELELPLLKVTSTELISGVSGESEENIRAIFDKAINNAPCVLFIDEIEAISQRRESATKNMEHRIVTQLLSCFDDLAMRPYVPIVVIGATNQVDSLDIGLRRAGRFDQEIPIGIPDEKQRKRILEILCKKIKMSTNIEIEKIVMNTPGYVGADLNALIDEALISSLDRRLMEQINSENKDNKDFVLNLIEWIKNKLKSNTLVDIENPGQLKEEAVLEKAADIVEVNQNDFDIAIQRVQPSSKREGFATVPDVSWDDVGALKNVREELKIAILAPVKYARQCEIFNFTKPPGILMVGPPGCGKTLLAKAIARESGVNFISVKGPELLNMYVGESERAVRALFQRARNSKPCVIFFDEIDAICVKRSDSSSDSGATTRVVNQMLTEMDGLESRKGVFLMAASNRPDIIDPAIMRPGRLDKIIYVGLPTQEDRLEILKTITKNGTKPRTDTDVNFEIIANDIKCQTYTGADLSALVREASEFALKEFIKDPCPENELVKAKHFEFAFNKIKPSVSLKDCEKYERMKSICINFD